MLEKFIKKKKKFFNKLKKHIIKFVKIFEIKKIKRLFNS